MKDDAILNVTNDVKWIGILDHDLVTFDVVMETKYGTTYNSYFINADKKTVIDTAKEKYLETYLQKLYTLVQPGEIDYIVVNHTEPDHAGCLRHLLRQAPQAVVVGSGNAIRYLQDIVDIPFQSMQVKDGDVLDLGNKTLRFIAAPNLHWPDTIYTWLEEDRLLFTCDSFGCHHCHNEMFDDLLPDFDDAFRYYFDVILKPYSKFVMKAVEKIRPLDIGMLCPGHGPILRTHWEKYVDISEEWAREYTEATNNNLKNILIAYVSSYGYTRQMAEALAEGIKLEGDFNIDIADIEKSSLGDIDEKLNRSHGILVGSPTLNQNILLPIYKFFAMINPIRERGKPAMSFGSYGWSGEAVKIIDSSLRILKLNVVKEGVAIKFYPFGKTRDMLVEHGREFGRIMAAETLVKEAN